MRLLLFIALSFLSTQNVSVYQVYDPNNTGPNLLDQDNGQEENRNNDSPNKKRNFLKIDIKNPYLKLILIGGAFGYLIFDSVYDRLSFGKNSQNSPTPKEPEPTQINGYYVVKIDGFTISMTEKEYAAYKKRWFKSDYFVENYQKFHSEGRIHSGRPTQAQPKPIQQKSTDIQPAQEQKPKANAEKEQKYLIIRERCQKDFPELQGYNKSTRCWIEKIADSSEIPDRYKKDLTVLSNDIFEMHEFNARELNDYIKEHNLTQSDWETLYGNEIQKNIHLDSIELLQQSRQPFKSIWMRENISVGDFAYVGGEVSADYTLMKTAGKLIKHAKKAAYKLRKFYRKHPEELVAVTPDGQMFKVIDESTQSNLCQKKSDKKTSVVGGGNKPEKIIQP